MIQIQLTINGEKKTFRATDLCMRSSIDAYELLRDYGKAEGDYDRDLIYRLEKFICGIFGDVFDCEDLESGYADSAFVLFPEMLREVIGHTHDAVVNFPKPAVTLPGIQGISG